MTQRQEIIKYMKTFGSISPFEAFTDLGITKLATRISEMKNEVPVVAKWETGQNRYGKPIRYKRYCLKEKQPAVGAAD